MACDPYWNQTVLACHFDGTNGSTTFTDEKGHTLTAGGNAQISTAQSKFGGSSAYFDGTGDYLTAADSDFDLGTGDFTFDCWFYYLGTGNSYPILMGCLTGWSAGVVSIAVDHAWGADRVIVTAHSHNSGGPVVSTTTAIAYNTWHHVAVVRSGTSLKIYFNGVLEGTATISASLAFNFNLGGSTRIGGGNGDGAASAFNGYIDDLRITKVARYTGNFTPDTSAFVTNQCAISGTIKDAAGANAKRLVRAFRRDTATLVGQTLSDASTGAYSLPVETTQECFVVAHDVTSEDFYWDKVVLACYFDGTNGSTTFTDEKGHTLTAYGNAQISTAQSMFGGSSAYFDGTDDYAYTAAASEFAFGPGDFVVEFFVRPDTQVQSYPIVLTNGSWAANNWSIQLGRTGVGLKLQLWAYNYSTGAALLTGATTLSTTRFYHVALVRLGNSFSFYVDGVLDASASWSGALDGGSSYAMYIGKDSSTTATSFKGYIDDLRVTKGVARYSSNFIPPAQAFSTANASGAGTENAVILDRVVPV